MKGYAIESLLFYDTSNVAQLMLKTLWNIKLWKKKNDQKAQRNGVEKPLNL